MDIKARADEITQVIRQQISDFKWNVDIAEVGTVIQAGDGIARVYGLEKAMAGELIECPHGVMGMVLNLEEDNVGLVLFGAENHQAAPGKFSGGGIVNKFMKMISELL